MWTEEKAGSSRGPPTRNGPTAWKLGRGDNISSPKNFCYEMLNIHILGLGTEFFERSERRDMARNVR